MVKSELIKDGKYIRHWSDSDLMIKQVETNNIYSEAIDLTPCQYTYDETDIHFEPEKSELQELADVIGDSEIMANDLIGGMNDV